MKKMKIGTNYLPTWPRPTETLLRTERWREAGPPCVNVAFKELMPTTPAVQWAGVFTDLRSISFPVGPEEVQFVYYWPRGTSRKEVEAQILSLIELLRATGNWKD